MAQVNKRKIPDWIRKWAWELFARMVHSPRAGTVLAASLKTLLTPTEMIALEKRLAIRVLLARGWSYRKIGRALDITRPTVSAVKRGMGNSPEKARPYAPLPPLKLDENTWYKRRERGKKKYYMGVRIHA